MTVSRDDRVRSLLVDAADLVATVEVTGWSPQAAEDAADTIDLLVESLGRLGVPVAGALAPVGPAMDALRVLIAASRPSTPAARTAGKDGDAPAPSCSRPPVLTSKRPGEEWLSRDPLRAEREYLSAHQASLEPSETDRHFSALPGRAKIAALKRIRAGEDRDAVAADLHRRHSTDDLPTRPW